MFSDSLKQREVLRACVRVPLLLLLYDLDSVTDDWLTVFSFLFLLGQVRVHALPSTPPFVQVLQTYSNYKSSTVTST